jgi:segregation and condensation protein B
MTDAPLARNSGSVPEAAASGESPARDAVSSPDAKASDEQSAPVSAPTQEGAAADASGGQDAPTDRSSDAPPGMPDGSGVAGPEPESPVPAAPQSAPDTAGSSAPPLRDPDEAALRLAEAAVFASVTPMTARALSQILPDDMDAAAVIACLRTRYEGRGIELSEIGGGLQFRTAADLAPHLRKVVQVPRRLPRVALETLAIIAYHQPVTRPEIEDMRGTGVSQQTLDVLLENGLIVARGRKETPGRPTLWGTTAKFLEYFGLRDIRELPRRQDLLLEAIRPEADASSPAEAAAGGDPAPAS